ncbi:hypothetical protein JM81_2114 [Maribacter sp. MAR_2009_72]|nr:hypothetical protein JM81_2114 [Maribacter sp. MAR_2009_72]
MFSKEISFLFKGTIIGIVGKNEISRKKLGKQPFYNLITVTFSIMNEFFFKAIREGNYNEVKAMLDKNAVLVNSKDSRGSTPLILATYYDETEIARLLLEKGAKIDAVDASGNTALMGVCFKGFTDIAKLLIDKGAALNERNAMGATCLIYAAQFNRLEIAKLLIANGADKSIKDNRGNSALDHAKTQGLSALIDLFE